MTIVSEHTKELDNWSVKLSLGAAFRKGNSDVMDYSAYGLLKHEDHRHRTVAEYNSAYGLALGVENTNGHRGNGSWNVSNFPLFYLTPAFAEMMYDKFKNVQVRALISAGGGVHVINTDSVALDLELTSGYSSTKSVSAEGGGGGDELERGGVIVPRLVFDWSLSPTVNLEAD